MRLYYFAEKRIVFRDDKLSEELSEKNRNSVRAGVGTAGDINAIMLSQKYILH